MRREPSDREPRRKRGTSHGAGPGGQDIAGRRREAGHVGAAESGAVPEAAATVRVNGRAAAAAGRRAGTLLDALRDRLGLTGTKKGCDQGACGACTVLVDGRRCCRCLTLAARCQGEVIATIEGLAPERQPAPGAGGVHRT